MRRITAINMVAGAVMFAITAPCAAGTNGSASAVQALGVTAGKPITNGFVFIDGKYLEPPYVVTRQGNGIFINGNLVEQPCPWPIPQKAEPVMPKEDPKMPQTINKDTSQYDKDLIAYLGAKKAYYRDKHGEKEMVKMMVKVYQELPCVLNAAPGHDEEHITVTWATGAAMEHRLIMPKRKITEWTPEAIIERVDKDRANYEERLGKGDFYFLGSHSRITGTADGARMTLPALLPILKTSKDAKEVQQRLQQVGISLSLDQKGCELFFTNRVDSKALDSRVEALTKARDGK